MDFYISDRFITLLVKYEEIGSMERLNTQSQNLDQKGSFTSVYECCR